MKLLVQDGICSREHVLRRLRTTVLVFAFFLAAESSLREIATSIVAHPPPPPSSQKFCIRRKLEPPFEPELLSFVKQVGLRLSEVHDFRTPVAILLLLHALLAVIRISHAGTWVEGGIFS